MKFSKSVKVYEQLFKFQLDDEMVIFSYKGTIDVSV